MPKPDTRLDPASGKESKTNQIARSEALCYCYREGMDTEPQTGMQAAEGKSAHMECSA